MSKRIVQLYVNYDGTLDTSTITKLVETDAPSSVIERTIHLVKEDNKLHVGDMLESTISIIIALGYKCTEVNDMESYGFKI